MPKLKTRKGLVKRVRLTASGKAKRSCSFAGHLLGKKSATRKRRLRKGALVSPADMKNLKRMIPYAKKH